MGAGGDPWEALKHPYPAVYSRLRQADAYFFKRIDSAQGVHWLRAAHAARDGPGGAPD